jgi:hypothetical protein
VPQSVGPPCGNVRLQLQALIDAGVYRDDILDREAMAQLVTGVITDIGIALAEAPARKRKQILTKLPTAVHSSWPACASLRSDRYDSADLIRFCSLDTVAASFHFNSASPTDFCDEGAMVCEIRSSLNHG